jgi:hypothetical protein
MNDSQKLRTLLDRHAQALAASGVPAAIGMGVEQLAFSVARLRRAIVPAFAAEGTGNIPLCITFEVNADNLERLMPKVVAKGVPGVVDMRRAGTARLYHN